MVKNMYEPNSGWPQWDIIKFLGSSDNYERANEKLTEVVTYNLSQVDTEVETTQKQNRKIRARKVNSDFSSDDNYHCINTKHKEIPEFPKLPNSMANQNDNNSFSQSYFKTSLTNKSNTSHLSVKKTRYESTATQPDAYLHTSSPVKKNRYKRTNTQPASSRRSLFSDTPVKKNRYESTADQPDTNKQSMSYLDTSSPAKKIYYESNAARPDICRQNVSYLDTFSPVKTNCYESTATKPPTTCSPNLFSDTSVHTDTSPLQEKSLKKIDLSLLVKTLVELKAQNSIILSNQERIFNQLTMINSTDCGEKTLDIGENHVHYSKFPILNLHDLHVIEELLDNESFYQYLAKRIYMYGGNEVKSFVKLALNNLLSNHIGTHITMTGKINKVFGNTNKISLKKLKLFNIICETGRKKFPNSYNDDAVMNVANSWLRHAKDRLLRINKDNV